MTKAMKNRWPIPKLAACTCGRAHTPAPGMPPVLMGEESLRSAAALLQETMGPGPFMMVADCNTQPLADIISARLSSLPHTVFTFPHAAEATAQSVALIEAALPADAKGLIAVGSGSITDCTRLVSFKAGLPFAVFPTAASMDGYLSWGAPVLVDGYKRTYPAQSPAVVIADPEIYAAAPITLTQAGFGDILGKYTSLADWRIGHLLLAEYWCSAIVSSVEQVLGECMDIADQLATDPVAAATTVMQALLVTGHAMICVGNSRPASGAEHHISHYWEMRALAENQPAPYHGAQVGVACVLSAAIYEALLVRESLVEKPFEWAGRQESLSDHIIRQATVNAGYAKDAAAQVLADNPRKHVEQATQLSFEQINAWWAQCRNILEHRLPSPSMLVAALRRAGAPATPRDLGISPDWVYDAIVYARELRPILTILDVAAMAGVLEQMAERLAEESSRW
ncbi:MAG TPA: sn-glycerol-1-phosphate dehydrogenase [Firmicutes bacterium]|nr:sn-glycerol-1-phosphate dehydrogenase [Bacillota bacterium]